MKQVTIAAMFVLFHFLVPVSAKEFRPIYFIEIAKAQTVIQLHEKVMLENPTMTPTVMSGRTFEYPVYGFQNAVFEDKNSHWFITVSHSDFQMDEGLQWLALSGYPTSRDRLYRKEARIWKGLPFGQVTHLMIAMKKDGLDGAIGYIKVAVKKQKPAPVTTASKARKSLTKPKKQGQMAESEKHSDTIYLTNGSVSVGTVLSINQTAVHFILEGETVEQTISMRRITKIRYRSGREQKGNPLPKITGKADAGRVIITYDPDEVEGLRYVGEIKGVSGWGGALSSSLGVNGAIRSIRNQAAKRGVPIVLIRGGRGGMTTAVVGEAYRAE